MKMIRITIPAAAMLLTGCVGFPTQPHLGTSNPANPNALEAAFALPPPLMMSGNNYAMSAEGEAQPMQMDMKTDMPEHGEQSMKQSGRKGHDKPSAQPKAGEQSPATQHEHHQDNPPKQ